MRLRANRTLSPQEASFAITILEDTAVRTKIIQVLSRDRAGRNCNSSWRRWSGGDLNLKPLHWITNHRCGLPRPNTNTRKTGPVG